MRHSGNGSRQSQWVERLWSTTPPHSPSGMFPPVYVGRMHPEILQKDHEHAVYGLKEKNLTKTYIKLIPCRTKDPDAVYGKHILVPCEYLIEVIRASIQAGSGDFSNILYEASKYSSVVKGLLSVDDLNSILNELFKTMGK